MAFKVKYTIKEGASEKLKREEILKALESYTASQITYITPPNQTIYFNTGTGQSVLQSYTGGNYNWRLPNSGYTTGVDPYMGMGQGLQSVKIYNTLEQTNLTASFSI